MNLEELLAYHAIERCLVEFARAMDSRDWPKLESILADDAVADFGSGTLHGAESIVALIRSYIDACGPTQHLLGNLLVDAEADTARSLCYVSDMHLGRGERAQLTYRTLGDYHDRWRRTDGRWRLIERRKDNRAYLGSPEIFAGRSTTL